MTQDKWITRRDQFIRMARETTDPAKRAHYVQCARASNRKNLFNRIYRIAV